MFFHTIHACVTSDCTCSHAFQLAENGGFPKVCNNTSCPDSALVEMKAMPVLVWARNFRRTRFHGLATGKDFMKKFHSSTIAKPHLLQEKGVACIVGKISQLKFSRSEVNP